AGVLTKLPFQSLGLQNAEEASQKRFHCNPVEGGENNESCIEEQMSDDHRPNTVRQNENGNKEIRHTFRHAVTPRKTRIVQNGEDQSSQRCRSGVDAQVKQRHQAETVLRWNG